MRDLRIDSLYTSVKSFLVHLHFDANKRRDFYSELIVLMQAGLSRSEALDEIWNIVTRNGQDKSSLRARMLASVRHNIHNGISFGDAMQSWIKQDEYMALRAIDGSEKFTENLEVYCLNLEKRMEMRTMIFGTLAYPLLLVVMAYSLLVYFSEYITPTLDRLLHHSKWFGIAKHVHDLGQFCADGMPFIITLGVVIPALITYVIPRWSGKGRAMVDRLPVFSTYRLQSGILYLQSMVWLLSTGLTPIEAIKHIRPTVNPYVGSQLDRIHYNLLNGADLGLAMQRTKTDWPDKDLNQTLRILARSSDFPTHLQIITKRWAIVSKERIERKIHFLQAIAFVVVFGVILSVVFALYSVQGQITASY